MCIQSTYNATLLCRDCIPQVLQGQYESQQRQIVELTERIYQIDPREVIPTELALETTETSTLTSSLDIHPEEEAQFLPMQPTTHPTENYSQEVQVIITREVSGIDTDAFDHEVRTLTALKSSNQRQSSPGIITPEANLQLTWADVAAGRKSPGIFGQMYVDSVTQQLPQASMTVSQISSISSTSSSENQSVQESTEKLSKETVTAYDKEQSSTHPEEKRHSHYRSRQQHYARTYKMEAHEQEGKSSRTTQHRDRRIRKKQPSEQQSESHHQTEGQEEVYYDAPSRRSSRRNSPRRSSPRSVPYSRTRYSPRESPKDTPMVTPKTSPTDSPKFNPQVVQEDSGKTTITSKPEHTTSSSAAVQEKVSYSYTAPVWDGKTTYADILKGRMEMKAQQEGLTFATQRMPEIDTSLNRAVTDSHEPKPDLASSEIYVEIQEQTVPDETTVSVCDYAVQGILPEREVTVSQPAPHSLEESGPCMQSYSTYMEEDPYLTESMSMHQTHDTTYQQAVSMSMFHHEYPVTMPTMQPPVETVESTMQVLSMGSEISNMNFYQDIGQYPVTTNYIPEEIGSQPYNPQMNSYQEPLDTMNEYQSVTLNHPTSEEMTTRMMPVERVLTPPMITPPETPEQYHEEDEIESSEIVEVPSMVFEPSSSQEDYGEQSFSDSKLPTSSEELSSEVLEPIDRSKLSYAQILTMGLKAAPSAVVTHTYGAFKSVMSYVKGPSVPEKLEKREELPSKVFAEQPAPTLDTNKKEHREPTEKKRIEPIVVVTTTTEPETVQTSEAGSKSEIYIPGLLFKEASSQRSRSKSARRRKVERSSERQERESSKIRKVDHKPEKTDEPFGIKEDRKIEMHFDSPVVVSLQENVEVPVETSQKITEVIQETKASSFKEKHISHTYVDNEIEKSTKDGDVPPAEDDRKYSKDDKVGKCTLSREASQPKVIHKSSKDNNVQKSSTDEEIPQPHASKLSESEEKRKRKKKRNRSNPKDEEDELEKALREIEEMEKSGKIQPQPHKTPISVPEEDRPKRKGSRKSRKSEHLSSSKPDSHLSQDTPVIEENTGVKIKASKPEKKKSSKTRSTDQSIESTHVATSSETDKQKTAIKESKKERKKTDQEGTHTPQESKKNSKQKAAQVTKVTSDVVSDDKTLSEHTLVQPVAIAVPEQVAKSSKVLPNSAPVSSQSQSHPPPFTLDTLAPVDTSNVSSVEASLSPSNSLHDTASDRHLEKPHGEMLQNQGKQVSSLEDASGLSLNMTSSSNSDVIHTIVGSKEEDKASFESKDLLNSQEALLQTTVETHKRNIQSVHESCLGKTDVGQEDIVDNLPCEQTTSPKVTDQLLQKPSFNLPMPEHANDWMEIVEEGGFSMEDEEMECDVSTDLSDNLKTESKSSMVSSDQKSIETEEAVEVMRPEATTTSEVIRKQMIKKIIFVDGKPVETEVVEEPEVIETKTENTSKENLATKSVCEPEVTTTTVRKVMRKRIIKKIVIIDGIPVETEEIVEDPEEVTEEMANELPERTVTTEIVCTPEITETTVRKVIRRRIIKKIVIIDGKPVEKEEVVEEPEEVIDTMTEESPKETFTTETVLEPEMTTKIVRKVIRRRIIKKIVIIDGKPVETEEVIEEPEEIAGESPVDNVTTETVYEPEVTTTSHKVIRRRVIKKIVIIDGKPVETEEVVEEPAEITEEMAGGLPLKTVTTETVHEPEVTTTTVHKVIRRKIIKKIVIIDGKPVETEEVIEEPEEVTGEMEGELPIRTVTTETVCKPEVTTTTLHKVIRRKIIKKIVIIDGKPVETEEVIEEPEEVTGEMEGELPLGTVTSETVHEPEVTTTTVHKVMRRKIIKKIIIIDGKPVETEEIIEEPEEVTGEMGGELPLGTVTSETVHEPEVTTTTTVHKVTRRKIIKKIVIIDGKPVETEEVVEEPEEITEEMGGELPLGTVTSEIVREPEVTTTTVHKVIRRKIIKKIVIIDGKPVETEEVIEEPEEVTGEMGEELPLGTVTSEIVHEPEVTTTTVHKVIRRKIVKKIVIIDGKPVETEEVIEEPEEVTGEMGGEFPLGTGTTETVCEPEVTTTTVHKVMRRKIIKKTVIIDGKPVETEEVIEEPEEVTGEMVGDLPLGTVTSETVHEPEVTTTTVHKVMRRKIIKKIVIIDGKAVETEEVIEEPEEVTGEMDEKLPKQNIATEIEGPGAIIKEVFSELPKEAIVTETVSEPKPSATTAEQKVIRKSKKVTITDGKPVETEEAIEESGDIHSELPKETFTSETVSEPEITTKLCKVLRKRVIKKVVYVDGKPVETEEVIEEPEDLPKETITTETVCEPEITTTTVHKILRRRVIKKTVIKDGKPVEVEEVVEEPEDTMQEMIEEMPKETITSETICEPEVTTTTIHKVLRKRIIKKIVFIDGKPVETEEIVEEPDNVTEEMVGKLSAEAKAVWEPEATSTSVHKVIRRKIIKKTVIVNGKPVETEEVVEEPDVTEEIAEEVPKEAVMVEAVGEPGATIDKVLRKRSIKKVVVIDGKPVETDEVIEEPTNLNEKIPEHSPLDFLSQVTKSESKCIATPVHQKETIAPDSKPDEKEKGLGYPESNMEKPLSLIDAEEKTDNLSKTESQKVHSESTSELISKEQKGKTVHRIIRTRIIRKVVLIDGKPVEREEVVEEPEDVTEEMIGDLKADDSIVRGSSETETSGSPLRRVVNRKVIKKIFIVDGSPIEKEEVIEEPIETTEVQSSDSPLTKEQYTDEEKAMKEESTEKHPPEKSRPTTFNLPVPDHANDWMEMIEGGGFSLEDEDSELQDIQPNRNVTRADKVSEKEENVLSSEKPQAFGLPVPDHANDWMEIIEDGGFTLDDEDEEQVTTPSVAEIMETPSVSTIKEEPQAVAPKTFDLPVPDHANDWMEIIEEGGFTLDDEEEDPSTSDISLLQKETSLTSKSEESLISKSSTDVTKESDKGKEPTVSDKNETKKSVDVSASPEDNVIDKKDVPSDGENVKDTKSFALPIPDHANDWMEIIQEGGFTLSDEEESGSAPGQETGSLILSAEVSKATESEIHHESKPSFALPLPDHANDFMEIIAEGGFTLDDEDSEVITETEVAKVPNSKETDTLTTDPESPVTYSTLIKSKHVVLATYVSKEDITSEKSEELRSVDEKIKQPEGKVEVDSTTKKEVPDSRKNAKYEIKVANVETPFADVVMETSVGKDEEKADSILEVKTPTVTESDIAVVHLDIEEADTDDFTDTSETSSALGKSLSTDISTNLSDSTPLFSIDSNLPSSTSPLPSISDPNDIILTPQWMRQRPISRTSSTEEKMKTPLEERKKLFKTRSAPLENTIVLEKEAISVDTTDAIFGSVQERKSKNAGEEQRDIPSDGVQMSVPGDDYYKNKKKKPKKAKGKRADPEATSSDEVSSISKPSKDDVFVKTPEKNMDGDKVVQELSLEAQAMGEEVTIKTVEDEMESEAQAMGEEVTIKTVEDEMESEAQDMGEEVIIKTVEDEMESEAQAMSEEVTIKTVEDEMDLEISSIDEVTESKKNKSLSRPEETEQISTPKAISEQDMTKDIKKLEEEVGLQKAVPNIEEALHEAMTSDVSSPTHPKEEEKPFALNLPEHINDWMDVIEEGGFTLDDEDENDSPVESGKHNETCTEPSLESSLIMSGDMEIIPSEADIPSLDSEWNVLHSCEDSSVPSSLSSKVSKPPDPSHSSYASILINAPAVTTEEAPEPKKSYIYKIPQIVEVTEDEADKTSKPSSSVDKEGFTEFVSKKERYRRKTHSSSLLTDEIKEAVDAVMMRKSPSKEPSVRERRDHSTGRYDILVDENEELPETSEPEVRKPKKRSKERKVTNKKTTNVSELEQEVDVSITKPGQEETEIFEDVEHRLFAAFYLGLELWYDVFGIHDAELYYHQYLAKFEEPTEDHESAKKDRCQSSEKLHESAVSSPLVDDSVSQISGEQSKEPSNQKTSKVCKESPKEVTNVFEEQPTPAVTKPTEETKAFSLPLPDHANDWMDIIEDGGFTLEDEEDDEKTSSTRSATVAAPELSYAQDDFIGYDIHNIRDSETQYYEYRALTRTEATDEMIESAVLSPVSSSDITKREPTSDESDSSWAHVVATGKPQIVEETVSDDTKDDKSFILYQTKTVKVVVTDEEPPKPEISTVVDEEGFSEVVSKQERRRRLRSSCSEEQEENGNKDVIIYTPRIELPEIIPTEKEGEDFKNIVCDVESTEDTSNKKILKEKVPVIETTSVTGDLQAEPIRENVVPSQEKEITSEASNLSESPHEALPTSDATTNLGMTSNVCSGDTKTEHPSRQEDVASWAHVVATGKPTLTEESDDETKDDKSFILYQTKTIKVVVTDEEPLKSQVSATDEEGFTEFISKQERRRRLRSSCCEEEEDVIKDIVAYTPRIELPEVEVVEDEETTLEEELGEPEVIENVCDDSVVKPNDVCVKGRRKESETPKKQRKRTPSHRKRQNSKLSDAEKEVNEILRQMEHEEVLQKYIVLDSFSLERWQLEDSERRYYEMLNHQFEDEDARGLLEDSDEKDVLLSEKTLETVCESAETIENLEKPIFVSSPAYDMDAISDAQTSYYEYLAKCSSKSPEREQTQGEIHQISESISSPVSDIHGTAVNQTIHDKILETAVVEQQRQELDVGEVRDSEQSTLDHQATSKQSTDHFSQFISTFTSSCPYDMNAIEEAETKYFEYLAQSRKVLESQEESTPIEPQGNAVSSVDTPSPTVTYNIVNGDPTENLSLGSPSTACTVLKYDTAAVTDSELKFQEILSKSDDINSNRYETQQPEQNTCGPEFVAVGDYNISEISEAETKYHEYLTSKENTTVEETACSVEEPVTMAPPVSEEVCESTVYQKEKLDSTDMEKISSEFKDSFKVNEQFVTGDDVVVLNGVKLSSVDTDVQVSDSSQILVNTVWDRESSPRYDMASIVEAESNYQKYISQKGDTTLPADIAASGQPVVKEEVSKDDSLKVNGQLVPGDDVVEVLNDATLSLVDTDVQVSDSSQILVNAILDTESSPRYDMTSIVEAETNYQEYMCQNGNPTSWAGVVASGQPVVKEEEIPEDDKSFILYHTKTIKVVVQDEEAPKPQFPASVDEEGFTEYVSKQERRRRLRSSCSEDQDDSVKEIVPYVPRIELPEVEIIEESGPEPDPEPEIEKQVFVQDDKKESNENKGGERVQKPIKPMKFIQDQQQKRHRSRVSEAEKEVDEILRQINHEEVLQRYASRDFFVTNQWIYSDAEKDYHEMIAKLKNSQTDMVSELFEKDGDDDDDDDDNDDGSNDDSSGSHEPPPFSDDQSDNSSRTCKTEIMQADLPHGLANWTDESTYLPLTPNLPDQITVFSCPQN